MDEFPPLPPPGLVAPVVPENAPMVLDVMPEVASPPLNIVPLASSDENVPLMAVDDVQDHSSFDLYAQMPADVLLGNTVEAASSSDSVAQVTQGVRSVSPVDARGAPAPGSARDMREAARTVSAPENARCAREVVTVADLQAQSQSIKHQRTMIDVGTFLERNGLSMKDFVNFQSSKYARNIDDLGFVKAKNLEDLKDNFEIQNGILRISNGSTGSGSESTSCNDSSVPRLTWSKIVKDNEYPTGQFDDAFKDAPRVISDNGDGTATLELPRAFLLKARGQWSTSCIGHFVGPSWQFRYVKEQATKLWSNSGLKNVYYNSKGFYTFRFGEEADMKKVLALGSVQMNGKRLYLAPWTDGATFQKNVIKRVSTWIKLVDVPHSYWTMEGLGHIARAVGEPISLDKQTSTFHPMKYAGVLVEIQYGASFPKAVWVPVLEDDNCDIVKVKVGIEYSSVPQSCSFCKAFGHYDSRCEKNPSYVKPPTKEKAPVNKGKGKVDASTGHPVEPLSSKKVPENSKVPKENPAKVAHNTGTSNQFSVLEEGEIGASAETVILDISEPLETNCVHEIDAPEMPHGAPVVPLDCPAVVEPVSAPGAPLATASAPVVPQMSPRVSAPDSAPVAPLECSRDAEPVNAPVAPLGCPEDVSVANMEMDVDQPHVFEVVFALPAATTPPRCPPVARSSDAPPVLESPKNKRKKGRAKGQNGPFFTDSAQTSPPLSTPSKRGKNVDEDGFTQVESKRSLRSRGKVTNPTVSQ